MENKKGIGLRGMVTDRRSQKEILRTGRKKVFGLCGMKTD